MNETIIKLNICTTSDFHKTSHDYELNTEDNFGKAIMYLIAAKDKLKNNPDFLTVQQSETRLDKVIEIINEIKTRKYNEHK